MKVLMDQLTKELIVKKLGDKIGQVFENDATLSKYIKDFEEIVESKVVEFITNPEYASYVVETTFADESGAEFINENEQVLDLTKLPEHKLEEAIDRISDALLYDIILEFNVNEVLSNSDYLENIMLEHLLLGLKPEDIEEN
jgi:hypothetical protein